ncbi:MAG: hypothetical protein ABJF88_11575 [Rhodothermales bacterium]
MSDELLASIIVGLGAIALGLLAWFLPYRWNLFRLKAGVAKLFSERVNRAIPKGIGALLIAFGVVMVGAALFWEVPLGAPPPDAIPEERAARLAGPSEAESTGRGLLIFLLASGLGLSGWLRPYERNPFRLRPSLSRRLPERWNRIMPKVFGTIFIGAGVYALFGGA